jgi:hypothetical protein
LVSREILPEFPGFTKRLIRNSEENSVKQNSDQPGHFRKDEEFRKTDVIGLFLAVRKATLLCLVSVKAGGASVGPIGCRCLNKHLRPLWIVTAATARKDNEFGTGSPKTLVVIPGSFEHSLCWCHYESCPTSEFF